MVEEGWLIVIDPKTLETMLRARSEVAVRMIRLLAARLERANQQIELLVLRDADHRVVRLLSHEAKGGLPHPQGVLVKVGVPELAGRTGLEEETVREVLARLEAARLLVRADAGLIVPAIGKLSDFLEFLELKERFAQG
jgi:CRP-like cAMP-binding protein